MSTNSSTFNFDLDLLDGKQDQDFPILYGELRQFNGTTEFTRQAGKFTDASGREVVYPAKTGRKFNGTVETPNMSYAFEVFVAPEHYSLIQPWTLLKKGQQVGLYCEKFSARGDVKIRNIVPVQSRQAA